MATKSYFYFDNLNKLYQYANAIIFANNLFAIYFEIWPIYANFAR